MNPVHLSIVALIVIAAAALASFIVSQRYQRRLALTQVRSEKHRQFAAENLDRVKRQVGQLQEDLSTARQEIKRLTRERPKAAAAPSPVKPSTEQAKLDLMQVLVDKPPRHVPAHGFADTLPSRQFDESLVGVLNR